MNTESNQKKYVVGQRVALRFRAIGDSAPGIYTLQRADGTAHGALCRRDGTVPCAPWSPRGKFSMVLPPVLTVWAEVSHKTNGKYTLALPNDLSGGYICLTAGDLAACDVHAIEQ